MDAVKIGIGKQFFKDFFDSTCGVPNTEDLARETDNDKYVVNGKVYRVVTATHLSGPNNNK